MNTVNGQVAVHACTYRQDQVAVCMHRVERTQHAGRGPVVFSAV